MDGHDVDAGEWVEVASCRWMHEAQFLKSVLDSFGIEAVIPDEHTLGVNPLYASMIGWPRVLVRPDEVEAARDALASAEHPPEPDTDTGS